MQRRFFFKQGKQVVAGLVALFICLATLSGAVAQGRVAPNENRLEFRGLVSESVKRTFTLSVDGDPIRNVAITPHDLREVTTGNVLLSSNVSVNPATVAAIADRATFEVTIGSIAKAGHYTGTLGIQYDG
ncbi:MAG TPA: hypothetical protein VII92_16500, partial [Anaerolineae bacterium]